MFVVFWIRRFAAWWLGGTLFIAMAVMVVTHWASIFSSIFGMTMPSWTPEALSFAAWLLKWALIGLLLKFLCSYKSWWKSWTCDSYYKHCGRLVLRDLELWRQSPLDDRL